MNEEPEHKIGNEIIKQYPRKRPGYLIIRKSFRDDLTHEQPYNHKVYNQVKQHQPDEDPDEDPLLKVGGAGGLLPLVGDEGGNKGWIRHQ